MVPIKSEDEVSEDDLRSHHLLLIGRPATNSVTARCQDDGELPVHFGSASFDLKGETYAHARSAVVLAAANPLNDRYQVVVFAGLSAEATFTAIEHRDERHSPAAEIVLFAAGHRPRRLCVKVEP